MNQLITVYAYQDETLSHLLWRHLGQRHIGLVEQTYEANPDLCLLPAALPAGTAVNIPRSVSQQTPVAETGYNMWD